MKIGSIDQVLRYPVKSMVGESLASAAFDGSGMRGDRAWAVRDEVRGGIRGAKKLPSLMELSARYPSEPGESGSSPAEITFQDGTTGATGDADIAERVGEAIGSPVSLWPLVSPEEVEHYRRGAPSHDDPLTEMRAIFGREEGEPLPDLSIFPPEIFQFESPPGTYFDAFPLLLLTRESLATLTARAPDCRFEVARFRPNILIASDDSGEPFPELSWRHKKIRIGTTLIQVGPECPRCVMTTQKTGDLPKDPLVMRNLVKEAEGNLGVYASVVEAGVISVGDDVLLVD
jgi:uncharacterized protein YcbX